MRLISFIQKSLRIKMPKNYFTKKEKKLARKYIRIRKKLDAARLKMEDIGMEVGIRSKDGYDIVYFDNRHGYSLNSMDRELFVDDDHDRSDK